MVDAKSRNVEAFSMAGKHIETWIHFATELEASAAVDVNLRSILLFNR